MHLAAIIIVSVLILILALYYAMACQKPFRDDMIRHFDKYLQDSKNGWNYILPQELHSMDMSKVFILDVRKPDDYKREHIQGSINIFWLDLMKPENLAKLPTNREIVVVCYVGHTSSQVLVLLKLLGYKAKALKFGMGTPPSVNVPVAGWSDYGFETESE